MSGLYHKQIFLFRNELIFCILTNIYLTKVWRRRSVSSSVATVSCVPKAKQRELWLTCQTAWSPFASAFDERSESRVVEAAPKASIAAQNQAPILFNLLDDKRIFIQATARIFRPKDMSPGTKVNIKISEKRSPPAWLSIAEEQSIQKVNILNSKSGFERNPHPYFFITLW